MANTTKKSLSMSSKFAVQSGLDDQIKSAEGIASQMDQMHIAKSDELVRLLKLTEDTSRRVVAAEMDVRRQRELQARLELDVSSLEDKIEESQTQVTQVGKHKEELADKAQKLNRTVDELRKERSRLEAEVEGLSTESKELHTEVDSLDKKKAKLSDDIMRLKKLRQEYMATISKLRAEKDDLTD